MADWTREFDEPIPVPKGRRLVTLRDAGDYVAKLPKANQSGLIETSAPEPDYGALTQEMMALLCQQNTLLSSPEENKRA